MIHSQDEKMEALYMEMFDVLHAYGNRLTIKFWKITSIVPGIKRKKRHEATVYLIVEV